MATESIWTPERDTALRAYLAENMSFAIAAAKLGSDFNIKCSRAAAIGRANRLGIKSRIPKSELGASKYRVEGATPWEAEGISRRSFYMRKQKAEGRYTRSKPTPEWKPRKLPRLSCAEVEPLHLNLIDLEHNACRWPYGDGPYTFCGHPVFSGCSYCEAHAALSVKRTYDRDGVNPSIGENLSRAMRKANNPTRAILDMVTTGEDGL